MLRLGEVEPAAANGHVVAVTGSAERTDEELWSRAVAGDEAAFCALYDRYAPRLLGYAHRRTASVERAEDVVSLVMLETWRRRTAVRFAADGSMAGWMFRTTQYVLSNERRAARRHRDALERTTRLVAAAPEEVDRRVIEAERLRQVLSVLEQLPPRDREILALAAWSGLTERDMATTLGIRPGTFKSRLSRARHKLADRSDQREQPSAARQRTLNSMEALP
jgi:RNA polymerase sigma factor (sigma-70 family)